MTTMPPSLASALADRYRIERELGAGGMATVYLAEDLRHHRQVAIKVLHPDLAAVIGGDRFLTEIRVTAHLQHPHLLPLFDSGEVNGLLYYVMPFVAGESLRARLERERQLPVDEALRIATAIASALDYAHRHGVIHRDLKPENILLQDGQPIVADFGIALAVSNAGGARITQTGLSLGTPAYMSPEQATGDRQIDARTDIYSLGAVVFEMLVGEPPHHAATSQGIIAKVLTERPPRLRTLRETVPHYVESAVDRALAKLPADRFATAREFGEALAGTRRSSSDGAPATTGARSVTRPASGTARRVSAALPWIVAVGGVIVGVIGWITRPAAAPVQRGRFVITLPDSLPIAVGPGPLVALSPDGTRLAYVAEPALGTRRIFVRAMNEIDAHPLAGTDQAIRPSFSPNGDWLAFTVAGRLRKVGIGGGRPVTIAEDVGSYSWGDGDVVVFAPPGAQGGPAGLWRVSANGGTPERLTIADSARGTTHIFPHVLPGGKAALFTLVEASDVESGTLAAIRLDGSHDVIRLGVTGVNPRYVSTGHVLLGRLDGSLIAVPFDVDRLEVTGPPVSVLDGILVKNGGATEVSLGGNGTIAYVDGSLQRRLVLVDRTGRERPLANELGVYSRPRLSPDGRRLAVSRQEGADSDIWVYDRDSGTWTRLTTSGRNVSPAWMPDGRHVAWLHGPRGRAEVKSRPWDGSEAAQTIATPPGIIDALVPSPRRDAILFHVLTGNPLSGDIYIARTDSLSNLRPLLATPENETGPAISSDGNWLAYGSGESGQPMIYARRIADSSQRTVVSAGAAHSPLWSGNMREIFYRAGGRVIAATVDTSRQLRVIRRDTLFADVYPTEIGTTYDVAADGAYFVFPKPTAASNRIIVALGWIDELRERMAARGGK